MKVSGVRFNSVLFLSYFTLVMFRLTGALMGSGTDVIGLGLAMITLLRLLANLIEHLAKSSPKIASAVHGSTFLT